LIGRRLVAERIQETCSRVRAEPEDVCGRPAWERCQPSPAAVRYPRGFTDYWRHQDYICEAYHMSIWACDMHAYKRRPVDVTSRPRGASIRRAPLARRCCRACAAPATTTSRQPKVIVPPHICSSFGIHMPQPRAYEEHAAVHWASSTYVCHCNYYVASGHVSGHVC
jgi:hypothetical protein